MKTATESPVLSRPIEPERPPVGRCVRLPEDVDAYPFTYTAGMVGFVLGHAAGFDDISIVHWNDLTMSVYMRDEDLEVLG